MATAEGKHIVNEAQNLTEKMQDGVYTAPVDTSTQAQGGATAVQFQRKFIARDPKDDLMNIREQLNTGDGMTPFGQMYYDDSIGKWIQRKEAVAEAANFNSWFNRSFNKNNLADRAFAQQINPEFYNEVDREMMQKAQVITRIKSIQNRGPQNEEDVYMLYLLDTGKVVLPPDWDRLGPSLHAGQAPNATMQQRNFAQGLIRMPKFLTQNQMAARAQQNAAVGAPGSSASATRSTVWSPWANTPNANTPLSRGSDSVSRGALNFLKQ